MSENIKIKQRATLLLGKGPFTEEKKHGGFMCMVIPVLAIDFQGHCLCIIKYFLCKEMEMMVEYGIRVI